MLVEEFTGLLTNYLSIEQASSAAVVVGSVVWVEDPDDAWIDGEVAEVNGEEVTINCFSGKTVSTSSLYDLLFLDVNHCQGKNNSFHDWLPFNSIRHSRFGFS